MTWDFGTYPHFKTKRGYGVTFPQEDGTCHVRFAEKILTDGDLRADGVLRHELGHVVDMLVPPARLTKLLGSLPPRKQAELRADAIAEAIWDHPMSYDKDDVQTTGLGTRPRPKRLGF